MSQDSILIAKELENGINKVFSTFSESFKSFSSSFSLLNRDMVFFNEKLKDVSINLKEEVNNKLESINGLKLKLPTFDTSKLQKILEDITPLEEMLSSINENLISNLIEPAAIAGIFSVMDIIESLSSSLNIVKNSLKDMSEFLNASIVNSFAKFDDIINSMLESCSGFLNINTWLEPFISGANVLMSSWRNLKELFSGLLNNFDNIFNSFKASIANFLKPLTNGIDLILNFRDTLTGVFSGLFSSSAIGDTLTGAFGQVKDIFDNLSNIFNDSLKSIFDGDLLSMLTDSITSIFGDGVSNIIKSIFGGDIIKMLTDTIKSIFGGDLLGMLADAIPSIFGGNVTNILTSGVTSILGSDENGEGSILNTAMGSIKSIFPEIPSFSNESIDSIRENILPISKVKSEANQVQQNYTITVNNYNGDAKDIAEEVAKKIETSMVGY